MSKQQAYPISIETKGITGRDGYIVAEALVLAIKWIDDMPDRTRPTSDRQDIIKLLNAVFPEWEDVFGPA